MTFVKPPAREKQTEILFPETRNLFLFLRKVVAHRRGVSPLQISSYEVGKLLSNDHKFAHQFRFGKRQVIDVGELEEISQQLNVPLDILAKVALGIWDADFGYEFLLKWEDPNEWVDLHKVYREKEVEVEVRLRVLASAKAEAERTLEGFGKELKELVRDPEKRQKAALREMGALMAFLRDQEFPMVSYIRKKVYST